MIMADEVSKGLVQFGFTILALGLTWLVGKRIAHVWAMRKYKQERDIEACNKFQLLYGEYFATWKLWNYYISDLGKDNFPDDHWWKMMEKACASEGNLEALLLNISSTKILGDEEIDSLGGFRQGYQQLRLAIKQSVPLNWITSQDPQYLKFKRLSSEVQKIIISDVSSEPISSVQAARQLEQITSNKYEAEWRELQTYKTQQSDAQ